MHINMPTLFLSEHPFLQEYDDDEENDSIIVDDDEDLEIEEGEEEEEEAVDTDDGEGEKYVFIAEFDNMRQELDMLRKMKDIATAPPKQQVCYGGNRIISVHQFAPNCVFSLTIYQAL